MEHIVASTDFFADAAEYGAVAEDRSWPEYSPEELLTRLSAPRGPSTDSVAVRLLGVDGSPLEDRSMLPLPADALGQGLSPMSRVIRAGQVRTTRRRWDLNPRTLAGHTISNPIEPV